MVFYVVVFVVVDIVVVVVVDIVVVVVLQFTGYFFFISLTFKVVSLDLSKKYLRK